MNRIIKSILVGALLYIFFLLGFNANLVSKNVLLSFFTIIGMTILLYVIIFDYIKNKENIGFGILGFMFAKIALRVIFPLFLIFYTIEKHKEEISTPQSILEEKNISFEKNATECQKIKYGTFVCGYDTIIRLRKDSKDFEIVKTSKEEKQYHIKWLDSCTYYRVNSSNMSIEEIISMGNFLSYGHYIYSKPATAHELKDERILLTREVKTNPISTTKSL
jgi:hypothetical protein